MNGEERIAAAFKAAAGEGRAALMPYMMAGFPDRESGLAVARAYVDAGADLIELGVPFSDPLADGPTIHSAATQALAEGATLRTALEGTLAGARRESERLRAQITEARSGKGQDQRAEIAVVPADTEESAASSSMPEPLTSELKRSGT